MKSLHSFKATLALGNVANEVTETLATGAVGKIRKIKPAVDASNVLDTGKDIYDI